MKLAFAKLLFFTKNKVKAFKKSAKSIDILGKMTKMKI